MKINSENKHNYIVWSENGKELQAARRTLLCYHNFEECRTLEERAEQTAPRGD